MNTTRKSHKPTIMTAAEKALFSMTGEELLMAAIRGDSPARQRIHQELDLRALLAEGPRRAPARTTVSRLARAA